MCGVRSIAAVVCIALCCASAAAQDSGDVLMRALEPFCISPPSAEARLAPTFAFAEQELAAGHPHLALHLAAWISRELHGYTESEIPWERVAAIRRAATEAIGTHRRPSLAVLRDTFAAAERDFASHSSFRAARRAELVLAWTGGPYRGGWPEPENLTGRTRMRARAAQIVQFEQAMEATEALMLAHAYGCGGDAMDSSVLASLRESAALAAPPRQSLRQNASQLGDPR
jgi:hypothetical protein